MITQFWNKFVSDVAVSITGMTSYHEQTVTESKTFVCMCAHASILRVPVQTHLCSMCSYMKTLKSHSSVLGLFTSLKRHENSIGCFQLMLTDFCLVITEYVAKEIIKEYFLKIHPDYYCPTLRKNYWQQILRNYYYCLLLQVSFFS